LLTDEAFENSWAAGGGTRWTRRPGSPRPTRRRCWRSYGTPRRRVSKLRLFAVACCREVWEWLKDGRAREAVQTAERYADGLASREELSAADRFAEEFFAEADLVYGGHSPATATPAGRRTSGRRPGRPWPPRVIPSGGRSGCWGRRPTSSAEP